ncbi:MULTISPECIES: dipeptidase [unclassified Polaromonas]|uniref:dipeptidase n=1 Tax=unclassified Polaromonas TaxID=2638319 RepID=UPI000F079557|nr:MULTISPECIES: membrane dipeptidase [unclassified Polaromonas]AYQ28272.1 hypothetical protein DT070_09740 [Polaromonas sp. SP1]QGJ20607.1 hypothetical protein F7R28_20885 [Polaromonas sp. Pch-P]
MRDMSKAFQDRRALLGRLAGMGAAAAFMPLAGFAQAPARVPIADMHSHLGIVGRTRSPADLATEMKTHGATLVSWAVVGDALWLAYGPKGIVQKSEPTPAELSAFFEKTLSGMVTYAEQNQLAIVRTGADVDAALGGKHSVLLASESAEFISTDLAPLKKAFDMGLRQLQLVHYIRNPIGDFSTASPVHKGLSPLGRDVIKACEAQGILVDLAHCSTQALEHAFETATKPMIWSHGWVDSDAGEYRDQYGYLMRRLSVAQAKKIAAGGGVVGLWGLGLRQPANAFGWKVGLQDRAGYARELARLVGMIGADHVALGTDIAGVGDDWTTNDYSHVREVVQLLEGQKLDAATIEKVAFGNFARVLKATLPKA